MPTPQPSKSAYGNGPKKLAKSQPVAQSQGADLDALFEETVSAMQGAQGSMGETSEEISGPQPSGTPIPSEAQATGMEQGQEMSEGAPAESVSLDSLLDESIAQEASAGGINQELAMPSEEPPPPPGRDMTEEDTAGFFTQAWERFAGSFAGNKKELQGFMAGRLGNENVRIRNDEVEIRRPGSKKWVKFDKDGLELLDIADFARDTVEELVTDTTMVGLGLAGTAAAPGVGTAAGIAGGRVLGGVAGFGLGELIARAFGVPLDPDREITTEAAISGAANAVFGAAGDKVMGAVKAYRGKKALIPTHQTILQHNKTVLEAAQELEQKGLIEMIPGTNTPIRADQIHPNSTLATRGTKYILSTDDNLARQFRKSEIKQGELMDQAIVNYADSIAHVSKKSGGVTDIAQMLDNVVENVYKNEGDDIGKFTAQSMQKLGKKRVPVTPELGKTVTQTMEGLGFKFKTVAQDKTGRLIGAGPKSKFYAVPPKLEDFMLTAGIQNDKQAKALLNQFSDLFNRGMNGGMQVDEYLKIVNKWSMNLKSAKQMKGVSLSYQKILSELRNSKNNAIRSGLDEIDGKTFDESIKKYSNMLKSHDMMGLAVGDEMTQSALLTHIMSKGKDGLNRLKGMKGLLKDNPDAWNDFRGAYIEKVLMENKGHFDSIIQYDVTKIRNTFDKLDPAIRKEMFETIDGADGYKDFRKMLNVAESIKNADTKGIINTTDVQKAKSLLNLVLNSSIGFKLNSLAALFGVGKSRKSVFNTIMTQEGIEGFLTDVPKAKRGAAREMIAGIAAYAETLKVPEITKRASRADTRDTLREGAQVTNEDVFDYESTEGLFSSGFKVERAQPRKRK